MATMISHSTPNAVAPSPVLRSASRTNAVTAQLVTKNIRCRNPVARFGRRTCVNVQAAQATGQEVSLSERIENGMLKHVKKASVERVLESLHALASGEEFVKTWPEEGLQMANSYIRDLSAIPFHDSMEYKWAMQLEENAEAIQKEFLEALDTNKQVAVGGDKWSTAVREDALAYGPEWRTLVLQDRGQWDETNTALFPKTTKLVQKFNVPSSEVFFAVQSPNTGIKPHTDNTNFILTGHLGLIIPEGDCWIKVGNQTRNWEEGKTIIMDTSFMHETENNTESPRYVLIFRFWHPELTEVEKSALLYIFDCLDAPETAGIREAQKTFQKRLKKLKPPTRKGGFGGGGFGSR
eukprot:CAMPEP_0118942768 /NCGR_PEP_ID=MMETSP1169-20130426/36800_1 /TAXON_ID=36882 /ORGANISM="Pyramimonas obovata, Strain CCMP722" /LENGTH=350 /DNA_ID=CAMNT_0006887837 /DNA_START=74 /DNA_END=1126 /DNA_ORIENTATION=+